MEGELFPFLFVDSADQWFVKTVIKNEKLVYFYASVRMRQRSLDHFKINNKSFVVNGSIKE